MIGNAAAAEVFEPARLGPVGLRNRVIKAATFEGMTPRGLVTDELIEFHRRFAQGGVGMTTVAYCAVSPEGFAFVAMARALLREPDLLHRIRSDPQARSLCIHCNKCMPTIYSGTRCVLATPDGGVTARRQA